MEFCGGTDLIVERVNISYYNCRGRIVQFTLRLDAKIWEFVWKLRSD